jgi:uncharacterized membrane protein YgaE (UPF0421/DUF939 family)
MTLGFAIAISIAHYLGLDYGLSAGIIGVLNMLDTKRASARVAWRRLYSSALGLLLASMVFHFLGLNTWVLIIVVGFFIPIAFLINAREGIAVHIVLTSHLIQYESLTVGHLWNEYLLVIIGAAVALSLNIHMPNQEKNLIDLRKDVEASMKCLIKDFSCSIDRMCLLNDEAYNFDVLEGNIKAGKILAYDYMNNYYLKDHKLYLEYFQMRLQQVRRLKYMKDRIEKVIFDQNEVVIIRDFIGKLADVFDFKNDGLALLEDIDLLKVKMENFPLPKSQYELKQKSVMLEFLNDLEEFVRIKVRYSQKYSDFI